MAWLIRDGVDGTEWRYNSNATKGEAMDSIASPFVVSVFKKVEIAKKISDAGFLLPNLPNTSISPPKENSPYYDYYSMGEKLLLILILICVSLLIAASVQILRGRIN